MFLEVAVSGNAAYLVTGNIIHFHKGKNIVTPKDFLDTYTAILNK